MTALPSRWEQNETPESWVTRSYPKFPVLTDVVGQGHLPQTLANPAGPSSHWMRAQHIQHLLVLARCLPSPFLCFP